MLTRHLYDDTEVRAALAYAILRGRALESTFWCDELTDTGLEEAAWATLLDTWRWQALVTFPEWAALYYKKGALVDAAQALCRVPKDNSLWWVLVSCLNSKQPDRITYRGWTGLVSADECFRLALLQKKARLAWWLVARGLVKDLGSVKGAAAPLSPLETCVAILLACCDPTPGLAETFPLSAERAQWLSQKGRYRERRRYSIPVECLYGRGGRGLLPQSTSTLPSLWATEATLRAEQATLRATEQATLRAEQATFWSALLPPSSDEEAIEAFYTTYFPDDLPEECLTREQELFSHGPGLLRSSEFSWSRLSRIWFRSESRFAWGLYEFPDSLPSATDDCRTFESILALQSSDKQEARFDPRRPKIEIVPVP